MKLTDKQIFTIGGVAIFITIVLPVLLIAFGAPSKKSQARVYCIEHYQNDVALNIGGRYYCITTKGHSVFIPEGVIK